MCCQMLTRRIDRETVVWVWVESGVEVEVECETEKSSTTGRLGREK